jgi:hypothetical protein
LDSLLKHVPVSETDLTFLLWAVSQAPVPQAQVVAQVKGAL